jgi:hypothetical protein
MRRRLFGQKSNLRVPRGAPVRGELTEYAGLYMVILTGTRLYQVTSDDVDGVYPCMVGTDLEEIRESFRRDNVPLVDKRKSNRYVED